MGSPFFLFRCWAGQVCLPLGNFLVSAALFPLCRVLITPPKACWRWCCMLEHRDARCKLCFEKVHRPGDLGWQGVTAPWGWCWTGWRVKEGQSTRERRVSNHCWLGITHPGSHMVVVSGESKGGVQAWVVFKDPQVFLRWVRVRAPDFIGKSFIFKTPGLESQCCLLTAVPVASTSVVLEMIWRRNRKEGGRE